MENTSLNIYASRPQNQPGQVKKHKVTGQPRYNDQGEILCTYCVTYKPKEAYLTCNLRKKHYKCMECEHAYRVSKVGDINRLIDNIYNHQSESGTVLYTWDQLSDWLMKKTNFMEVYKYWKTFEFEKMYTPAVLRIDASKPYSLDNLRVTTSKNARKSIVQKRERRVIQLDDNGKELATYPNARVAAQILNLKNYSRIHEACKRTKGRSAGYFWKYA